MSANFGRIMWIMETNIWLLEPLIVLNIQIFDIYIQIQKWLLRVEITFLMHLQICFIYPIIKYL